GRWRGTARRLPSTGASSRRAGEVGDLVDALHRDERGVHVERVYRERLRLTPGAQALLEGAKGAGLATLLVSGGFTFFTERLRERLGFTEAHANELVVEGGRLAGRVTGPLVDAAGKAAHVVRMRRSLGIGRERVLVIGDGANDLAMMAEAGTSIAFRAKPVVRGHATYALTHAGLDGVLALFPP
ncbi:MAG: HAD-IB family phosphatase, partial [Burkholderiales bacterium]|nr:HAD-IB family phosphatase [Burkholderiales bacterium]